MLHIVCIYTIFLKLNSFKRLYIQNSSKISIKVAQPKKLPESHSTAIRGRIFSQAGNEQGASSFPSKNELSMLFPYTLFPTGNELILQLTKKRHHNWFIKIVTSLMYVPVYPRFLWGRSRNRGWREAVCRIRQPVERASLESGLRQYLKV